MAEWLVSLHDVSLGYPGRPVLDHVTLTVEQGDVLVLVGPNGAGKTTLLRGLAGLLRPRSGRVIRRADAAVGYVPQERELDPIFPLSGRALAAEPTLMVLDEPTSGTDPASEGGLLDVLRRLRTERGLTVVLATHDLTLAANHATRVAIVDRARGVFRVGPEAEILRDDVLTRLYGCDVRVRAVDGWRAVLIGQPA